MGGCSFGVGHSEPRRQALLPKNFIVLAARRSWKSFWRITTEDNTTPGSSLMLYIVYQGYLGARLCEESWRKRELV
ncbi:hypothetical protein Q9966_006466 [Columba livia]|nr:hypothetical protein Q9966_006466 [Columba livia]